MTAEPLHQKSKTAEVVICNAMLSGDECNWAYHDNAVVVRQIHSDDPDRYPTISGDEIADVLTTDYKIQIFPKDKTKPSLIFILREKVISPPVPAPAG